MVPEILMIIALLSLSAGVFLAYGLPYSLITAGVYLGIVSFSMAHTRGESP